MPPFRALVESVVSPDILLAAPEQARHFPLHNCVYAKHPHDIMRAHSNAVQTLEPLLHEASDALFWIQGIVLKAKLQIGTFCRRIA